MQTLFFFWNTIVAKRVEKLLLKSLIQCTICIFPRFRMCEPFIFVVSLLLSVPTQAAAYIVIPPTDILFCFFSGNEQLPTETALLIKNRFQVISKRQQCADVSCELLLLKKLETLRRTSEPAGYLKKLIYQPALGLLIVCLGQDFEFLSISNMQCKKSATFSWKNLPLIPKTLERHN